MVVLRSRLFASKTFLNSLQVFKPVYIFWSNFLALQSLIWASVAVPLRTKITEDYSEWSLGFISRFGDKHFWASIWGLLFQAYVRVTFHCTFCENKGYIFHVQALMCDISFEANVSCKQVFYSKLCFLPDIALTGLIFFSGVLTKSYSGPSLTEKNASARRQLAYRWCHILISVCSEISHRIVGGEYNLLEMTPLLLLKVMV